MATAAKPEPKMSGWKMALAYAIAVPADVLKFLFATFIFSAPFFAAMAVDIYLSASGWPSWAASLASVVVGGGIGAVEIAAAPIAAALTGFGVVMAILIGFVAWLLLTLLFVLSGINPFGPRQLWKVWIGWLASVAPFLNLFPTVTPAVWLIVRDARKADREALAAWKRQNAEQESQARTAQQQAESMRQQEAAEYAAAQVEAEAEAEVAANENDEIPEERKEAA